MNMRTVYQGIIVHILNVCEVLPRIESTKTMLCEGILEMDCICTMPGCYQIYHGSAILHEKNLISLIKTFGSYKGILELFSTSNTCGSYQIRRGSATMVVFSH